ncbi:MAG: hypothetical protein OXQ26_13155 [bacterium]|nr:hypothetical protein [bacterium]
MVVGLVVVVVVGLVVVVWGVVVVVAGAVDAVVVGSLTEPPQAAIRIIRQRTAACPMRFTLR